MTTPAHKQTDPAKKPGQITNPINTDLMDDMGQYAAPYPVHVTRGIRYGGAPLGSIDTTGLTRRGNPVPDIEPAKRVTWSDDGKARFATDRARTYIRAALRAGAGLDTILKDL